jgi:uncharacterized protein YeaO (DUF488 family)
VTDRWATIRPSRSRRGPRPATSTSARTRLGLDLGLEQREDFAVDRSVKVQVARVYEEPSGHDGVRVLVDRLWPRGLTKQKAALDEWCKQVAPSTGLRKWYGHDPGLFAEFRTRYRAELQDGDQAAALAHLRRLAGDRTLILLTASREVAISEAAVLAELIEETIDEAPSDGRAVRE